MALTQEQLNRILGKQSVVQRAFSENRPTISTQKPSNDVLNAYARGLEIAASPLNVYSVNKNVPLIGGMTAADFIGANDVQSLAQDVSYGKPIVSGGSLQTSKFDPRLMALADFIPAVGGATKLAGAGAKAGAREIARQIETGTGIIGKNVIDPRQYMFVGEKGINNLGLQNVLAKANEMKAAKVPDEKIWSATAPMVAEQGVRGGGITFQFGGVPHLEISDDLAKVNPMAKGDFNFAPLSQILEHPTLYKAQPSLKAIAVSPQEIDYSFYNRNEGLLGVGTPHRTTTGYNDNFGNRIEQYNFKPDVIGHEVNHAIQFDQNLPQGGNKSTKKLLNKFFEAEKKNYDPALSRIANEQQNLSNLYKDSAILDFNRILNKPSYKPSDLYRRNDFYQYSDEIRSKLGTMPKKAGESRNEYIRNANQIIFDKYKEKKGITQQDVDKALGKTSAQTKYQINKIYKKLEPDYAANRELAKLKDKNYQINELTPYQVYDRLTGEATSRLVQDRWDMTPEQRGLLYPVPKLMDTNQKINPYELIDLYYN